ncbi:carcinoembryonic antigen-related cell adhesion molecule 2-like isoform X2 [Dendropsophus ebraccatus]
MFTNPEVTWIRDEHQAIIIARKILHTDGEPEYNPMYRDRCKLMANGSLRLDRITDADAGNYLVNVMDKNEFTSWIIPYYLEVYGYLVINGALGGSAYFNVSEPTTTDVSWQYKSPQALEPERLRCNNKLIKKCETKNGSLILYNITYNDEGEYIMTYIMTECKKEERYYLQVYDYLSAPVLRSNHTRFVTNGTNVTLRCDAEQYQNVTAYTFYQDQTPICFEPNVICRGRYLDFTPITEKHSGSYTCTIRNPISNNTSDFLNLTVLAPVTVVTVTSDTSGALWAGEDSVSLYCTAQGSPITFSWSLNGNPVSSIPPYYITQSDSPPSSNLTISPVSKNDIGSFTCTASSLKNNKSSNAANLNINWYPEGIIQCIAKTTSQTVQLGCKWSRGKPAAYVTMVYNNTTEINLDGVSREVALSSIIRGSNLICNGIQLERTSSCVLLFYPISQQGLNGEVIAGIVTGILAGIVFTGVIVYFVLRRDQMKPKMSANEGADLPPPNIYENISPGVRIDKPPASKQDTISEFQQMQHKEQPLYCNVMLGRQK